MTFTLRDLLHPIGWLRGLIQNEVRTAVQLDKMRVLGEDPIRVFQQHSEDLTAQIRHSANVVGRDVMIGRDVILWGGSFPGGVGLRIADQVRIYDYCRLVIDHLTPTSGITLEEGVAMNFGCYIEGAGGVRIGRRSILGPHVVIVSSGHRIDPDLPVQESGKDLDAVTIGENVWIGANAVIMKGVTIGDRAVIGAGTIVTRAVDPDTVVVGNPARVLRKTRQ